MMDLRRARDLLEREVGADRLLGAALQVSTAHEVLDPVCVGRRQLATDGAPVEPDTIFLIASITKPIVAAAVLRLVEEGHVLLSDPVTAYVPEFGVNGKEDVRLRHLLTHTSGLPDMIDCNREYRAAQRPLADFVARICELPLGFEPGSRVSYQSTGIAMLGEIVERVAGVPLPRYLHDVFFAPLGLRDTHLGIRERNEREAQIRIAGEGLAYGAGRDDEGTDFDWNSDYWRGFAAPWGGLLTTVGELTTLMRAFLAGGSHEGARLLSPVTVAAMVTDQTSAMPGLEQTARPWGLGWQLQGRGGATFGDLVSARTFGHGGATGTVAWADPEREVTCVLLTNDPAAAGAVRPRISNLVAAA
jgi:CubicO group peptidase (beta-lactamase class C family)